MATWKPLTQTYVRIFHQGEYAPVGTISLTQDGRFETRYFPEWVNAGFAIDPLRLPLNYAAVDTAKLPGVFADSLPDDWGQRVVLSTHRQAPQNLIEWAIASAGNGVGALMFSASRDRYVAPAQPPSMEEIAAVAAAASAVDGRELVDNELVRRLLWPGSSMGGARPKATVRHEGTEWLAKFSRAGDVVDTVRAEHASLLMAKAAGINTVDSQLVALPKDKSVLLVRRFDRTPAGDRIHYLSANTLIGMDRISPNAMTSDFSYSGIANRIRKVAGDAQIDSAELFRRMVFNILVGNTDDHLRNHGFLHVRDGIFALAPAFDVVPTPGATAVQAIGVGLEGRESTIGNALSRSETFGLNRDDALAVISEVTDVVSTSREYFQRAGMAAADINVLGAMSDRLLDEVDSLLSTNGGGGSYRP